MLYITCIPYSSRCEEEYLCLLVGSRPVLDSMGNDDHLPRPKFDRPITKVDTKASVHTEEEFVLVFMTMPDELPLHLGQLDNLAIQFANDLWPPLLGDSDECVAEIDFVHGIGCPLKYPHVHWLFKARKVKARDKA